MSNPSCIISPIAHAADPAVSAKDVCLTDDARVETVVQEAVEIAAADRERMLLNERTSNHIYHSIAMNNGSIQPPRRPMPPSAQTSDDCRDGRQQFVTMSELFHLLHTAEMEGRLAPEKGSRLRHVLIDAEQSAHSGGGCWMNVAFRILCELIPPPVCPVVDRGMAAAGELHQSNSTAENTSRNFSLQTAFQDSGFAPNNEEGIDNNDAVAALLDMKLKQSPISTNKRKARQEQHPSSEPPNKTQATAIYPYPFSDTVKDPKLYRRTRCKAPHCPNNGGACPDHGHDIKICKVEDCTNRAVKSGVCSKHGAKRPLCRVDGCTNQAKKEGRCIKHGAVYGNCSEDGCVNQARSGGLCRKHGAK